MQIKNNISGFLCLQQVAKQNENYNMLDNNYKYFILSVLWNRKEAN